MDVVILVFIYRTASGEIDIEKTLSKRRIARDLEIKMMEVVLRKKKLLEVCL